MGHSEKFFQKIKQSRKYRFLYEKTIQRVVDDCIQRFGIKCAEKEARNLLHQIWGSYYKGQPNFQKLLENVERQIQEGVATKDVCLQLLSLHTSTKERISSLDHFYLDIFEVTGPVRSVIDHGCGLNPLSYPWIHLAEDATYTAYDIDREAVEFIRNICQLLNIHDKVKIEVGDILTDTFEYADVVFLLKMLPCLEHQKSHFDPDIIKEQKCKYLVVSYPIHSLSGKQKGMRQFYEQEFYSLFDQKEYNIHKLIFPSELVFVVHIT